MINKNRLATLSLNLLLLFVWAFSTADAQNYGGGRLEGTWDALVNITNCSTGGTLLSFQSTANFNKGGTFTGITAGMPPALRTPEVGVWRHEIGNSYRFRFKAYQFNPAGVPIRYQIVTHDAELSEDGQTYTSSGEVKFFLMNGTPDGGGCSTSTATRFTLD